MHKKKQCKQLLRPSTHGRRFRNFNRPKTSKNHKIQKRFKSDRLWMSRQVMALSSRLRQSRSQKTQIRFRNWQQWRKLSRRPLRRHIDKELNSLEDKILRHLYRVANLMEASYFWTLKSLRNNNNKPSLSN